MCGRFVSTSSPDQVVEQFGVDVSRVDAHEPDWNVAPRRSVYAVRDRAEDDGVRRYLDALRWGLVPSWAKERKVGDRMINARAETVASKPAYRSSFVKRRCIIPADGFYEWQRREGRNKQPMFIHRRDGEPLALAGLWSAWRDPDVADDDADDAWLRSCVIVTTTPNDALAPIHDRMPVVLDASTWSRWLDPDNHDADDLATLLRPAPSDWFDAYPVSTKVNRPANNDPSLLERLPA